MGTIWALCGTMNVCGLTSRRKNELAQPTQLQFLSPKKMKSFGDFAKVAVYLCTKIKGVFSCEQACCSRLWSLCAAPNISWTKCPLSPYHYTDKNPEVMTVPAFCTDESGRSWRPVVTMLTQWSLQDKAEILHLHPWHWIWKEFMRKHRIVEPQNGLCCGFSHFFNLFPQGWSSLSIIHEGFGFKKEEESV